MNWDVRDLKGKTASIEIVDDCEGDWGHIMVDQIELRDAPAGPVLPASDLAWPWAWGCWKTEQRCSLVPPCPRVSLPGAAFLARTSGSAEAIDGKLIGSLG